LIRVVRVIIVLICRVAGVTYCCAFGVVRVIIIAIENE
jgi:hypothetical protein